MGYTNKEKIEYFKCEKIPHLKYEIAALLAAYSNNGKVADEKSWHYRKAKADLLCAENRLTELEAIDAYLEQVGNLPTTTLTISKNELFLICAEKVKMFDIESSSYINAKFKSGKAIFSKIVLACDGLTLRCDILKPAIKRDKKEGKYTICFEKIKYTASAVTSRKIEKMKN